MSCTGIYEIKTDAYDDGRPKPECFMQVHHQMICTDLDWGIIACIDQHFQLKLYPVHCDPKLEEVMLKKVNGKGGLAVQLDAMHREKAGITGLRY